MDLEVIPRDIEPSVSSPINVDNTLGAMFIGAFIDAMYAVFNAFLYGILSLQCYIFFSIFSKDIKLLKASVAAICATIIYGLYHTLITDYCALKFNIPLGIVIAIVVTAVSDALIRGWFAYRVWILSKNWYLLAVLAALSISVTMSSLWLAAEAFISSSLEDFNALTWLFNLSSSLLVGSDAYIALALCFYLHRQRNPLNTQTNSVINFVMVYTINTGLFTTIITVACMITHRIMMHNYVFTALYFPLGPLYANALLGSLNARDWFRKDNGNVVAVPLHSFNVAAAPTASQSSASVYGTTVQIVPCKPDSRGEVCFDGAV